MLSDTLKKNIIFINSARVIACFFIAQERAQYRAEAHDMEVSENGNETGLRSTGKS